MEEQVVQARQQESNSEGYLSEIVTLSPTCMPPPNYSDKQALGHKILYICKFIFHWELCQNKRIQRWENY